MVGATNEVNAQLAESATYDFELKNKDINDIYVDFEERRADANLFRKTTLSNADANGNYLTETQIRYDTDGTTVLYTDAFDLGYDVDGVLISRSEVII